MEIHCQNSGSSLHATHRSDRYMQVISSTYCICCTFLWRLESGQFCESVTWLTCECACLQLLPYISLLPRSDYCPSSHRISQISIPLYFLHTPSRSQLGLCLTLPHYLLRLSPTIAKDLLPLHSTPPFRRNRINLRNLCRIESRQTRSCAALRMLARRISRKDSASLAV
jgi:hypothetical protein